MGGNVGCLVRASDVSGDDVKKLVSRLEASAVFVRGTLLMPSVRAKAPVPLVGDRAPGLHLGDDDSAVRTALDAALDAGADPYVVLSNPLAGAKEWKELLATDNGGRSAASIDPDAPALCPNHPKLLKWLTLAAGEIARAYKPAGVLLEDFGLGAPENVDSLFLCWCDLCRARADELGYDADRIRIGLQGARSKLQQAGPRLAGLGDVGLGQFVEAIGYDAGLLDWLNFRADSISACLYEIRQAVAGVDRGIRVGILGKAPTVAMLAGQRRVDVLRDTTLADFYAPVVCGRAAGVLPAIAGHAATIKALLPHGDEADALHMAAALHGYGAAPMPATIGELLNAPPAELLTASVERELRLTLTAGGDVPQWPAIDLDGLPEGAARTIARRIQESGADGLLYLGVPE